MTRKLVKHDPDALALVFAGFLKQDLSDREFLEVLSRNAARDPKDGTCASHDFCDANVVMEAAWSTLRYGVFRADSDADAALWNAAWNIARTKYLTGENR